MHHASQNEAVPLLLPADLLRRLCHALYGALAGLRVDRILGHAQWTILQSSQLGITQAGREDGLGDIHRFLVKEVS